MVSGVGSPHPSCRWLESRHGWGWGVVSLSTEITQ